MSVVRELLSFLVPQRDETGITLIAHLMRVGKLSLYRITIGIDAFLNTLATPSFINKKWLKLLLP